MAVDWKELHTFVDDEVALAKYFEDLRQNYFHIRTPRYAINYAKVTDTTTVTSGVAAAWAQVSTTYLDPVVIETTGRDILVAANVTFAPGVSGNDAWMGLVWDGAVLVSSTNGLGRSNGPGNDPLTSPLTHMIFRPAAGEHTLSLYWASSGSTIIWTVKPKTFLLAMEL